MKNQSQTDYDQNDPDAIQADIQRTRERIDETLDAVKDQLSPGELFDHLMSFFRAKSGSMNIGAKAGEAMSSVARTIESNPIPTALIGLGLLGLARGDGTSREKTNGSGANGGSAKSEQATGAAEQVQDKVQGMAADARESLERGYREVRQRLEDDPIVLGALGIALGAALGAGLPSTRVEDELLGEKRDELAAKAKQVVGEATHAIAGDDHHAPS